MHTEPIAPALAEQHERLSVCLSAVLDTEPGLRAGPLKRFECLLAAHLAAEARVVHACGGTGVRHLMRREPALVMGVLLIGHLPRHSLDFDIEAGFLADALREHGERTAHHFVPLLGGPDRAAQPAPDVLHRVPELAAQLEAAPTANFEKTLRFAVELLGRNFHQPLELRMASCQRGTQTSGSNHVPLRSLNRVDHGTWQFWNRHDA